MCISSICSKTILNVSHILYLMLLKLATSLHGTSNSTPVIALTAASFGIHCAINILTGVVLGRWSAHYRKLSAGYQQQARSLGVSFWHAVVAGTCGIAALVFDNVYKDPLVSISDYVPLAATWSLSYFVYDALNDARLAIFCPTFDAWSWLFLVHHVVGAATLILYFTTKPALYSSFLASAFATEVSTPAVNIRWFVIQLGWGEAAELGSSILMMILFLFVRLPFTLYANFVGFKHRKEMLSDIANGEHVALTVTMFSALLCGAGINLYWASLIVKGAFAKLFGASGGDEAEVDDKKKD